MATGSFTIRKTFEGEKVLELLLIPASGNPFRVIYYLDKEFSYGSSYSLSCYQENKGTIRVDTYREAETTANTYFKSGYYGYYLSPRKNTKSSAAAAVPQLLNESYGVKDKTYISFLAKDLLYTLFFGPYTKGEDYLSQILSLANLCYFTSGDKDLMDKLFFGTKARKAILLEYAAKAHFDEGALDYIFGKGFVKKLEETLVADGLDKSLDSLRAIAKNFPYFENKQIVEFLFDNLGGVGVTFFSLYTHCLEKGELGKVADAVLNNPQYLESVAKRKDIIVSLLQYLRSQNRESEVNKLALALSKFTSDPDNYAYLSSFSSLSARIGEKDEYADITIKSRYGRAISKFPVLEGQDKFDLYGFDTSIVASLLEAGIVKASNFYDYDIDALKKELRRNIKNAGTYYDFSEKDQARLINSYGACLTIGDSTGCKSLFDDGTSDLLDHWPGELHLLRAKAKRAFPKKVDGVGVYCIPKKEGK